MRLSSRAQAVAESGTLRLFSETARLRSSGVDVVSLLEGEPDWPVPAAALAATQAALSGGQTRYGPGAGLPELRAAALEGLRREGLAAEDVLVTNGAKQALYEALCALAGPGDEVVVPSPCWTTYPEAVRLAGAEPVLVPMEGDDLDVPALERAVTPRTRVLLLNTPNNPTGAVYSRAALEAAAALAETRDLVILSDEAYERFVYDGGTHTAPAALGPRAAARTATVRTCSKSYSMTGFRVGFLAGPRTLVRAAA
ncbi:MAG: aminotransferase class I/II-fold pyridoxal phosphate-dependent enzyme, partial [Elusimicrobia bacterium]|nr:aminotransferase class I/II-fold pyridoxal phosphate-dependent enzyme [Elusimicrobiota bacterium]